MDDKEMESWEYSIFAKFAAIQDKQVSQNHFETVHSLRNSVKATVPREFKCFFLLINEI